MSRSNSYNLSIMDDYLIHTVINNRGLGVREILWLLLQILINSALNDLPRQKKKKYRPAIRHDKFP